MYIYIRVSSPSLAIFFAVPIEFLEKNHEMKNPGPLGRENRDSLDCRVKTTYDILPIDSTLEIIRDYVRLRATKLSSINYIELRSGQVKRRQSRRKLRTGESERENR